MYIPRSSLHSIPVHIHIHATPRRGRPGLTGAHRVQSEALPLYCPDFCAPVPLHPSGASPPPYALIIKTRACLLSSKSTSPHPWGVRNVRTERLRIPANTAPPPHCQSPSSSSSHPQLTKSSHKLSSHWEPHPSVTLAFCHTLVSASSAALVFPPWKTQ